MTDPMEAPWVPQTDAEDRLLEDLHLASRRAHSDGVSRGRIASFLAYMAAATLEPREGESPSIGAEKIEEPEEHPICPECGGTITDYVTSFGVVTVWPCSHEIDYETARNEGWYEEP